MGSSHFRSFVWNHPEWWILGVSAAAWAILGIGTESPSQWSLCIARIPGEATYPWQRLVALTLSGSLAPPMTATSVMVLAMMPPLVILPARHAAFRSFWRRRHRAVAGLMAGYAGVWLVAGFFAVISLTWLLDARPAREQVIGALALAAAAGWQLTPFKRNALAACHRSFPLAPNGWRADISCVRYGAALGRQCIKSCGALMICPMVVAHSVWLMATISAVALIERYLRQPPLLLTAVALAAGALVWLA